MTRSGRTYTPAKTRNYETIVALMCKSAIKRLDYDWPMDAHYSLSIWFYMGDKRRRDIDNLAKSCADGAIRCAWNDDSQVREMHLYLMYDKVNPRAEVCIKTIDGF